MTISAISSGTSSYQMTQTGSANRVEKLFDSLGSALKSGDLAGARSAYTQLQKNAPTQNGSSGNPMSSDMESLGKALDSGDLKAAQDAYAKTENRISQMKQSGPQGGQQAGGPPSGGKSGGAGSVGGSTSGSSSSKVYDKMDANQDGTVSAAEELAYRLKHPEEADKTQAGSQDSDSSSSNAAVGSIIDTTV